MGDYLKLHFIVFIWGLTAILSVLISLPAVELLFYRTLISALAIAAFIYLKQNSLAVDYKTAYKLIGTGLLVGMHWLLFFWAGKISNASVSVVGLSTIAIWTSFMGPLFGFGKIKSYELLLAASVVIGIWLICRNDFQYSAGLYMSLISAFMSALFTVLNARFVREYDPYAITFYEMLGACIMSVLFMPFYAYYFSSDGNLHLTWKNHDWLWFGILTLVCTVYAFAEAVELTKRISPFMMNLTVNLEPVYSIILAIVLLNEQTKLNVDFYFGTAVILFSVLMYPVIKYRINKSSPQYNEQT
jgi:drug/metabolite transporter (DMT)-like permease